MVSGIEGRGFHTEYRVCGDDGEHRDCSPSGNHKRNQIGTGGNFAAVSRIRGNSRRRPAMIAGSTARGLHHSSARIGRVSAARAFQPEHCSWRLWRFVRLGIAALGRVSCRRLVSREAAKGNAGGSVRCSVFGLASRGRESAGVRLVALRVAMAFMQHRWGQLVSREAAKPRSREGKRKAQCSVFGVRSGEPRTGVRGWVLFVARAFQPEHIADSGAWRCV